MVDVIREPEQCPTCGQNLPTPADGRWRWARGSRVYKSIDAARARARHLRTLNPGYEFRAALDEQGRPRIASRRKLPSKRAD